MSEISEQVDRISRWRKTAQTWLFKSVHFIVRFHEQNTNRHARTLVMYEATDLLSAALFELECLVPIVDPDQLDELEELATNLKRALRNRRLALKLAHTDGRTPEEAESFARKAAELSA